MSEVMRAYECAKGMIEPNHCAAMKDRRNGTESTDAGHAHSYVRHEHSYHGMSGMNIDMSGAHMLGSSGLVLMLKFSL